MGGIIPVKTIEEIENYIEEQEQNLWCDLRHYNEKTELIANHTTRKS